MEATHSEFTVSDSVLVTLISQLIDGYPDPEDPNPPGPWDPVIRRVLHRTRWTTGPHPEPWGGGGPGPQPWSVFEQQPWGAFGPQPDPWRMAVALLSRLDWSALNPQPLPPRIALVAELAHEMIDRTSLVYDLAGAFGEEAQAHAQEVADTRLAQFIDDCGNGRIPLPVPAPWPPRGNGTPTSMRAVELVVMGVQFVHAARAQTIERLRHGFDGAGARLLEMGLTQV